MWVFDFTRDRHRPSWVNCDACDNLTPIRFEADKMLFDGLEEGAWY